MDQLVIPCESLLRFEAFVGDEAHGCHHAGVKDKLAC